MKKSYFSKGCLQCLWPSVNYYEFIVLITKYLHQFDIIPLWLPFSTTGFLNFSTNILGWINLCCGGLSSILRAFNRNPGLYPLDANSIPYPKVTATKYVSRLPNIPLRSKSLPPTWDFALQDNVISYPGVKPLFS